MKAIFKHFVSLCGLLGLIGSLDACRQKDDVTPAPVISRVRTVSKDSLSTYQTPYNLDSTYTATRTTPVPFDSTTALGKPGTLYAIVGQHLRTVSAVYFNDVNAYFNPALVTDNSILVSIPLTTPFAGSNKLRVVTQGGTVEYAFSIQQPAPVITRVDQLAGAAGDVITITGTTFDNVSAVRFGTVAGTITDKTGTQLKVTVPASVSAGALSVTTPGGTVTYGVPFGFRTPIFTDALATGWTAGGWSGTPEVPSKGVIKRGTGSLKYEYTGGFGGFQLLNGGTALPLAGATGLKFSIYGGTGTEGKIVKLVVNGNYDAGRQLVLHAGTWTDYAVPLASLGATGNLTEITLQEFSGNAPTVIYVDDLGLY
jgi:hypothetical protein